MHAREAANAARTRSNKVVGTRTTTKQQRAQAEVEAIRAENYATWAEATFDQAEVNAATNSVAIAQGAEVRARRSANEAATAAKKARAIATAARNGVNNAPSTRQAVAVTTRAKFKAAELEATAYRLEITEAVTAQYQTLLEADFTKPDWDVLVPPLGGHVYNAVARFPVSSP